ncbi:phosphoribosylaminoimidazolesuccinocarboxamide synthase [Erysipelothrix urinaevulpis]|uniref:phosphoribosylaminoimidazolesuccinocarboxamide synthase n=1 Tax=Erysipelothrix urinaevulpis TaxID=2683717 RepID=UPI0013583D1F|nr:phosphoribosylaminoimidazolesuccinocarboxamide synthase [Erysipelothrix urinaevulpis]
MKNILEGKTKKLIAQGADEILMVFKDDVTADENGFNPGANKVGFKMDGIGLENLKLSTFFFEKLNATGIKTHFLKSDFDERTMHVRKANLFGNGVEVICRFAADGSFVRRYGQYARKGDLLPAFVEMSLKDDLRNDPMISKDALIAFDIMSDSDYDTLVMLTRQICLVIKNECAKHNLQLIDIKLEFGRDPHTNEIMLIDEISTGSMRVYREGESVEPFELTQTLLSD